MRRHRRSLWVDALASLLGLALVGSIRLVYNAVLGRAEGVEGVGAANVLLGVALTCSLVAQYPNVGAQRYVAAALGAGAVADAGRYAGTARRLSMLIAVLFAVVMAGAGILVAWLDPVLLVLAATLVVTQTWYAYEKTLVFAEGRGFRSPVFESVGGLAFVVTLPLAVRYDGFWLAPFVAHTATYASLAWWSGLQGAARGSPAKALIRWSIGAYVHNLALTGLLYSSVSVVGWLAGSATAGLFAVSMSIASLFLLVPRVLQQALFPSLVFSVGQQRPERAAALAGLVLAATSLGVTLGAGVISALAPSLLGIAFGPGFVAAEGVLRLVVVAIVPLISSLPLVHLALAFDRVRGVAVIGVGMSVAAAAWWIMIPAWGLAAAGTGLLAAGAIGWLGAGRLVLRTAGLKARDVLGYTALDLLLVALVGVATHVWHVAIVPVLVTFLVLLATMHGDAMVRLWRERALFGDVMGGREGAQRTGAARR